MLLYDTRDRRPRENDVVFLGLWILYETKSQIVATLKTDDSDKFDERVQNLFQILSGNKDAPIKKEGVYNFDDVGSGVPRLEFDKVSASADQIGRIKIFLTEILNTFYNRGPNVQTILETSKGNAERDIESNKNRMIDRGVDALRFNQNPLIEESVKNLPEIARFRQQTGDALLLSVNQILVALERILNKQIMDKKTIVDRLSKKRNTVELLQARLEQLLKPRDKDEDLEPEIPYRPEGTWVMDSMFTGWIPLAPIVVYGIEQAYQLVADHVPRLAASNPSDDKQIKKAIEVLETDPRYRAYFVQIVARQMGLSRQAFNVRWMPDLTGDHMRVIMYNIRKLRNTNGRNVDAHFQSALRSL
jgi:hypothetical protein